jgi:hypothetical protein
MILCEWDTPEGHPGQYILRTPVGLLILSMSFISVSIFSVCCFSSVYLSQCLRPMSPKVKNTLGCSRPEGK